MEISYITAPLIGAIIGYSTNWLAIKMMFRPRKAIKLGKIKLPFTPGIIPRNRENIAKAISSTIINNLLTTEDVKKVLLSKEIEEKLINYIDLKVDEIKEKTLSEVIEQNIQKQNLNKMCDYILDKGTNKIIQIIKEKHVANIISEQIRQAIEEKINGTIFAIMGSKKVIESISNSIEEKINQYIDKEGEKIVYEMLEEEINSTLKKNVKEFNIGADFNNLIIDIYERTITENAEEIMKIIDIQRIIEDKINLMDIEELEKLILKIMKKELNAVINLGAIIGFILGLLNIVL